MKKVQCRAHNRQGEQCKKWAVQGATVCPLHGGKAPQVAARAAVTAEVFNWNANDETVDAGETLLRLVTQSWRRTGILADELTRYAEEKTVQAALTSDLARKEAEERDRCARFAALAVNAGLIKSQKELTDYVVAFVSQSLTRIVQDPRMGITADRDTIRTVIAEHAPALGA